MSDDETTHLETIEESEDDEHKTDAEIVASISDPVPREIPKSEKKKKAEELFEDPSAQKKKKARRPLSEERKKAMLENLRKGREKLAAQRQQAKKRENVKLDKKVKDKSEIDELKDMIRELQKQMRSANTKKEKEEIKEEIKEVKEQVKQTAAPVAEKKSKPIVEVQDVEPIKIDIVEPARPPPKIHNLIKNKKKKQKKFI